MSTRMQEHIESAQDSVVPAAGERREPGGRPERTGGGGAPAARRAGSSAGDLPEEVREQLTDELIDELLAGRRGEAEILGSGGLLGDLTRRLVERARWRAS